MKTTNARLAHSFIHGEKYTRGSNMYFEREQNGTRIMYSYGPHFPLASIVPMKEQNGYAWLFMNARSYSNTTQRHASHVRNASVGSQTRVYVDCPRTIANADGSRFADSVLNSVRLSALEYERNVSRALASRTQIHFTLECASNNARNAFHILRYFVRDCGGQASTIAPKIREMAYAMPKHARALLTAVWQVSPMWARIDNGVNVSSITNAVGGTYADQMRDALQKAYTRNERFAQSQNARYQRKIERERERMETRDVEARAKFLNGERSAYTHGREVARVDGDTLRTSKGYAVKADAPTLAMARAYIERLRNGDTFTERVHIGGTPFSVTCDGHTLRIGCHAFWRADVDAIANAITKGAQA